MKKETTTENKTMSDSTAGTLENKLGETKEPHLSFCLCPCLRVGKHLSLDLQAAS